MSEEEAFLAAIQAAPAEALPRLVYADWLEDHGDSRAEFLRLQQQLADVLARLQHARVGLDTSWVQTVEIRRDVVVHSINADRRAAVVKFVMLNSGHSLQQARDVLASLPSAVLKDLPLEQAERLRQELAAFSTVTIEPPATS